MMIRKISAAILTVIAILSWHCLTCMAENDILEQELSTHQQKLKSVETAIKKKKAKKRRIEKNKQDVLKDIEHLDAQIASQWESLERAKKDWTAAELQLEETRKALQERIRQHASLKKHTEMRFNAFRQMGDVGLLNVFFSSQSLPELLSKQECLKMILDEDRARRREYLESMKGLVKKKQELEKKQEFLKSVSERMEKEADLLEKRKQDKERYLKDLKQQSGRYSAMIAQLERARRKLKGIVEELTLKTRSAQNAMGPVTEQNQFVFNAQKGNLNLPAPGKVVYFKSMKKVPGIAISCPWGTQIMAIFDGKVVYNDSLPGYGRVFIVDHGNGYLSLIAQGQSFFRKVGDEVAEGEIVGISGGGPWISEGIYVEIRHNGKQLSPLKWFDLRGIEIEKR